jgi:hypothetical protein
MLDPSSHLPRYHDGSGGLRLRRTRRRAHSGDDVTTFSKFPEQMARRPPPLPLRPASLTRTVAVAYRHRWATCEDNRVRRQYPSTASAFSLRTAGGDPSSGAVRLSYRWERISSPFQQRFRCRRNETSPTQASSDCGDRSLATAFPC